MAPITAQRCRECGAPFALDDRFCATCGGGRQPVGAVVSPASLAIDQTARLRSLPLGQPLEFASAHGTEAGGRYAAQPTPPFSAAERHSAAETDVAPSAPRRSRRKFAALGAAIVLVCVIAVGGFYAIRVRNALHAMNAESTPSSSISVAALGGSSDATIDTGAARTAVANARSAMPPPAGDAAAALPTSGNATNTAEATTVRSIPAPPQPAATEAPAAAPTATGTGAATDVPVVPPVATGSAVPAAAREDPTATAGSALAPAPTPSAQPSPTAAVPPTPAPAATGSAASSPTASATKASVATTTPAASAPPTVAPAPTVVLSQIERIKNGDFEDGETGWNSDSGLQVVEGDAHGGTKSLLLTAPDSYVDQRIFFVANTTYQLTVWAKMSSQLGAGQVGVIFRDGDGKRLSSGQPEMVAVQGGSYTRYTLVFTPPAEAVAVRAVFGKGGGETAMAIDDVSVRSVVPPETAAKRAPKANGTSMTVLLMGVDARPGEAIDIGVRPDSLMVLHLDGETGACRLLSIPRDTRVELPGYGLTKINHALAVGGIDYEKLVVEKFLDVKIDHYVLLDFTGFTDMIDAVGGVRIDVPQDFTSSDGTQFLTGDQEMTGKLALSYSLWRGGADGDFGRVGRQHQVIQALVKKGSGLNIVRSINELLPAVERNLRTDLSPPQMAGIASTFSSRCSAESVSLLTLQGSAATYDDPLLNLPLYYIEVDEAEVRAKVSALYEP